MPGLRAIQAGDTADPPARNNDDINGSPVLSSAAAGAEWSDSEEEELSWERLPVEPSEEAVLDSQEFAAKAAAEDSLEITEEKRTAILGAMKNIKLGYMPQWAVHVPEERWIGALTKQASNMQIGCNGDRKQG
ncbi:hypothetical protein WJX72_011681 [[Myrmecia] bisecta]|uniref:Uncharacterized protein n=1 Tax=[Myrmecia] bisecta TaxID=41462 RepID=A0AAW1Q8F5_9CHLO